METCLRHVQTLLPGKSNLTDLPLETHTHTGLHTQGPELWGLPQELHSMPPLQPQLPFHPGSQPKGPTCLRVCWWAERARTISGSATGTRRMRSEKAVNRHTHLSIQSLWPVKPCSRSRLWADTELALGSAPSWSAGDREGGSLGPRTLVQDCCQDGRGLGWRSPCPPAPAPGLRVNARPSSNWHPHMHLPRLSCCSPESCISQLKPPPSHQLPFLLTSSPPTSNPL